MPIDEFDLPDTDLIEINLPALKAEQPIGDIYISVMSAKNLALVADFDVRRVIQKERDIEKYLGIQRPLNDSRVKELYNYVNLTDATFPTGVLLAISDSYATYDETISRLTIRNYMVDEEKPSTNIRRVARVIDGQHRIAGLDGFNGRTFEMPVTIFVGSDISDQAYIFATVNLEQTKVNKSLAYDLFELARTRSP